jgi:hypothetical protein
MQVEIQIRMKKVFIVITLLSFKQKDLSGFSKKTSVIENMAFCQFKFNFKKYS